MPEFALMVSGGLREFRNLPARPVDIPHKQVRWFPVTREYGEIFEGVANDAYVIRTFRPSAVPASITPLQARLALLAAGKLDAANAVVGGADEATKIAWEFAERINRNDPAVIRLAAAIGIDDEGLDTLFIEAAKL